MIAILSNVVVIELKLDNLHTSPRVNAICDDVLAEFVQERLDKRCFDYNASQVEDNIKAKELGIGVNGEYVLFYVRDTETPKPNAEPTKPKPKQDHTELMDGLSALGLSGLTTSMVASAVEQCYPQGTAGHRAIARQAA